MSVHDNGNGRPDGEYSRAIVIEMHQDSLGEYLMNGFTFLPDTLLWSWTGEVDDSTYYSQYMSTVDIQPNGNALICEAITGRIFEVTPEGSVAWFYQNPVVDTVQSQGDMPTVFSRVYRAEKYDEEYPAFIERDLTPMGTIEDMNLVSDSCIIYDNPEIVDTMVIDTTMIDTMMIDPTMVDTTMIDTTMIDTTQIDTTTSVQALISITPHIFPNPSRNYIWVNDILGERMLYLIKDLSGKTVGKLFAENNSVDTSSIPSGTYILQSYNSKGELNWSEKLIIMH